MLNQNDEYEHEHHHEHGEDCDCGHEHHHEHGEDCDCGDCRISDVPGAIQVTLKTHDEAIVVSGSLTVFADYCVVREELKARLEDIARAVAGAGGVVGHIKASATVTSVDMFSVTDTEAAIKGAVESEIKITLASIVFLVPHDSAEAEVRRALDGVKRAAEGA